MKPLRAKRSSTIYFLVLNIVLSKSSGTDNHCETYRSARNKATREIKKAKPDYVKRQANTLADLKCNLSRWWSIARDLCGFKSQRHSSVSPLLDQSKNLLLDDKEIANLLNDVFINQNTSLALEAFPFGSSVVVSRVVLAHLEGNFFNPKFPAILP